MAETTPGAIKFPHSNKVSSLNTWASIAAGTSSPSVKLWSATPFKIKSNVLLITNGVEFIYTLAQQVVVDNLKQTDNKKALSDG